MSVFGVRKLRRAFRRMATETNILLNRRLDNQARELLGAAQAVSPELTRRLILSGRVDKRVGAGRTTRIISFNTPYAVLKHEEPPGRSGVITRAKAATQDGPAGPKFLERPYDRLLPKFIRQMRLVLLTAAKRARRR